MQTRIWRGGLTWLAGMLLAVTTGCTISIQPWTKPAMTPATPGGPAMEHPGGSPYPPGLLPGSGARGPTPGAGADSMVQLTKLLNESDDNRKALQDQVFTLKKQLKDRDDNLRQASYEMEESSKHIKRTRDDFRQWHDEVEELRERVRKLEENRATLKPLIEEILHQLDRGNDPFKLPVVPRLQK